MTAGKQRQGNHEIRYPTFAARTRALAPGRLFDLLREARGYDAIDLALGIPGAPTPPAAMIDAACTALRFGDNQYEVPDGNPGLRRQIARMLATPADPATELTITAGATEGLHTAVLSVVDPGDEVVVFEPVYENFFSAIALAGGVPRLVRSHPPHWRFDPAELRAAFGPRTRAIVISTPNNPTGHVLTADELAEIAELCTRWNAVVISDEIYSAFVFDGNRHISAADVPGLRDRSLVVGSLSKSHAVSGWRIGYLRASASLTAVLRRVHVAVCGGAPGPLQHAAAEAAALDPEFGRPADDLSAQRHRVVKIFADLGFRCVPPDGGCYLMADIRPYTDEDCETTAHQLVKRARVLVAPGRFFHFAPGLGDEYVRIAFNREPALLDEVARRLAPGHLAHR
ncbi:MAG: pyridoxal phosphate-dependent aminotransferase [Kibdelosporangium sp.]